VKIELLTRKTYAARLPELGALLIDAVRHGASVGFVLPLADGEVGDYWRKVCTEVTAGQRLLFAAFDEAERLVGSAQLVLESRANGRHRAEVQKVMVLASHRGRGLGAALMARVEAEAHARGRLLLHLDTSVGESGATRFYDRLGCTFVGGIPDFAANPDGSLAPNAIYYKRLRAPGPSAKPRWSRNP
jgi:GNAT superfamily N-acetyltransferase